MIERDAHALSACGIHVRRFDGTGGKNCPACRAHHAWLASPEAISARTHTHAGKPITKSSTRPIVGGGGKKLRFGRARLGFRPSDRAVALRDKGGQSQ